MEEPNKQTQLAHQNMNMAGQFQAFNFPFAPEQNVSHSFVDYGCTSALDLDLERDTEMLVVHSKRARGEREEKHQLFAHQPTLPFLQPNELSPFLPGETLSDYKLEGRKSIGKSTIHVDNFCADHPEIMFGSLGELLKDELNRQPWNTCGKLCKTSDLLMGPAERGCEFCASFNQASSHLISPSAHLVQHLGTALPDIPPQLLENLCLESNVLEIPRLHYDMFMGNVLASHTLEDDQCVLMYPSGHDLDVLNFSHVLQIPQSLEFAIQQSSSSYFKPIVKCQQFANQGRIQQIDCASFGGNSIIVGIRSRYSCTFFQGSVDKEGEKPEMLITPLETTACTQEAMCIAVSPYIPGEGVVVTKTGRAYLWCCGRHLKAICPPRHFDYDSSDILPWYQTVFAANPRCVVMADSKGVDLMDFRAGKLYERLLFSIPSNEVDSFECISSIQRHPQNAHHYILATDQSLMILDDRFLLHPVLKWRHHNEDPIQFINIVCGALPECDDTLLLISGSKHRQTHCFQYSNGGIKEGASTMSIQCVLPPQSTCMPWKVSSYEDWYFNGLHSNLSFSRPVAMRLSKPLIGICTVPHPSPRKGFTVFQMSSVGDLFYQSFGSQDEIRANGLEDTQYAQYKPASRRASSGEIELSRQAEIRCQEWMDLANHQDSLFQRNTQSQCNFLVLDKDNLFKDVTTFDESPHPSCLLCNSREDMQQSNLPATTTNLCKKCDVDVNYSAALLQSNRVLTRRSLGVQSNVRKLDIFVDPEKAKDPLSQSLLLNWNRDVAIPIVLPGEQADGDSANQSNVSLFQISENRCEPSHYVKTNEANNLNAVEAPMFGSNPLGPATFSQTENQEVKLDQHSSVKFDSAGKNLPKKLNSPKKLNTPKKTVRVMGF